MLKIPNEILILAEIFKRNKHKLYIVGGFIRDSLLNIKSTIKDDIDLCSDVTPKELRKILENSEFIVKPINEFVGVMSIEGNKRYEYATFREENYETNSHTPSSVRFINDLETDAKRRDFKINSIYYDITEKEFIDPLGGMNNIKERIVETTRDAKFVFNDDPERILRLIRFACSLSFDIPEYEFKHAKKNSNKVSFISKFRLRKEFEKILTCDQIYPELPYTSNAHFRAMLLIGEFDLWKFILPEIDNIKKSNIVDKKGELIYEHTLNCLKFASPKIRMAVLLHDAAKVRTMKERKSFFGAKEFVGVIVDKNLGIEGLGYNKEFTNKVTKIILGYDFNNHGFARKNTIKQFIFKNKEVIENIIEIKTVIKNENRLKIKPSKIAEKIRKIYNEMLIQKSPFYLEDLKIRGNDIIEKTANIRLENLDELLKRLLMLVAINPKKNNKQDLLVLANKVINSNRDFYLEQ